MAVSDIYMPVLPPRLEGLSELALDMRWSWSYSGDVLYGILENEVVPAFYTRDESGIPPRWVALVRESMSRLTPYYSTNRMVREYTEKYYIPAADEYLARAANNAKRC